MKVQLTRDLALPLAKKGCTFGVELKTTGKDGEPIYFVHICASRRGRTVHHNA